LSFSVAIIAGNGDAVVVILSCLASIANSTTAIVVVVDRDRWVIGIAAAVVVISVIVVVVLKNQGKNQKHNINKSREIRNKCFLCCLVIYLAHMDEVSNSNVC